MQETYKGLPVVGESVVLEMDDQGQFTGEVTGRLLEGINEDIPSTKPGISPEEALEKALAYSGHNRKHISFNPYKDAVLEIEVRGEENVRPRLVYQLNYRIERKRELSRPSFIIDANTGHILKNWNAMTMANWRHRSKRRANAITSYELADGVGGNVKIGKHLYGLDLPSLKVSVAPDGRCVLENQYALVYNCNDSYGCYLDGVEPHHFDCAKGNSDTVNDAYSPLNDAFFYVGLTYEMYAEWYEISDILQNKEINGGRCPTRVHYGERFENAFWDGEVITFGDGESTMYPLTSLNVVAHEISHGFTEVNSGLVYAGESGGMNEAFSDMAGEAAEDFLKHKIDWMVGFAIWKKKNESMRYFDEPSRDGKSIEHFDEYCFDMDPHYSSGIFNKAFYILSNLPGWCVRKAFHIFVVANDIYWGPDSNFHNAACDVQRAADDLGYNVNDVTHAFREVGIEPCSKKHDNDFGKPFMVKNESSISFKLNNAHDEDLNYMELILHVRGTEAVSLMVQTPNFKYTVEPTENNIYGSEIKLNLGRGCYEEDCIITLTSKEEAKVFGTALAQVQDLVAGINLEANYDYNAIDESSNSTIPSGAYSMSFEIPNVILDNELQVMFTGSTQTGTYGTYYIRHREQPNLASYEYDLQGTLDGDPVLLCKPREGLYYLVVPGRSGPLFSINIKLGAVLKADLIEADTDNSTPYPTPSFEI